MAGTRWACSPSARAASKLLLQRVEPQRVQPRGLGGRPRRLRQTQQRRPAPEGERVGDRVRGATRIAGAERAARSREQLLELDGVDDRSVERVPVSGEPDRVRPQRPAQPGHVVLHGVSRRAGKIAAPQRLDQRVRGDDATRSQGQARHERLPLGARHVHRRPATTTSNGPRSRTSSFPIRPALRSREQSGTPGCAVRGCVTRPRQRRLRCGLLASGAARPAARRPPAGRASPPAGALGGRGSDERPAGSCMAARARIVPAMTRAIALGRS